MPLPVGAGYKHLTKPIEEREKLNTESENWNSVYVNPIPNRNVNPNPNHISYTRNRITFNAVLIL